MCEDDIEAVFSIEIVGFNTPWTRTSFYDELRNPLSMLKVAESNGNVVGYVCSSHVYNEGHLLNLAVSVLYRKMGIACLLVKTALKDLKAYDCEMVYLEVRASNKIAVSMYEKLDFIQYDKRKNYYRNPREDAILMIYDLSEDKLISYSHTPAIG
ncbi:MAG: ribosomal protein S18-alanine N-acetyltransferase [Thermodesulfovibrionales bacterium]